MDDASFYHSEKIAFADASVKLIYLPLYSPDFNPIIEFFAEINSFIKRNWAYFGDDPSQGFDSFLEWCIKAVGAKGECARGHFQHAGIQIEFCDN